MDRVLEINDESTDIWGEVEELLPESVFQRWDDQKS
jgi:hypothetical protein